MPSALPKKTQQAEKVRPKGIQPGPDALEAIAKAAFAAYFSEHESKQIIGDWDTLTALTKKRWLRVSLAVLEAAELANLK